MDIQSKIIQTLDREITPPVNIIFLGMSGAGKSHWSTLLANHYDLPRIEFDELIGNSKELFELTKNIEGEDQAEKMGKYFGMPWTDGYDEKERLYLDIETQFMTEAVQHKGAILDLTGSAIYHPDQMAKVRETGLVIYLETSKEAQNEMFEIFKSDPKPLCWNGIFEIQGTETPQEALERCYPTLLNTRSTDYASYADVTIPHDIHKNTKTLEALVSYILEELS